VQNSGTTWILNAVWFVSPTVGYAVGYTGIFLKTIDGVYWERKNSPYGDFPSAKSLYFNDFKKGKCSGGFF